MFLNSNFAGFNIFSSAVSVFWSDYGTFYMGSGPNPQEVDGKAPTDLSKLWTSPIF